MFANPKSTASQQDAEMVDLIASSISPTQDEVNDWHFVNQTFTYDWERPLVQILRFFVAPSPSAAQHDSEQSEVVEEDCLVDLVTAEVFDLTAVFPTNHELAS